MAGFRALQLIPGVGPATARKVLDRMAAASDPADALLNFGAPAAIALQWQAFADTYADAPRQCQLAHGHPGRA
jgi:DNA helicase-2/ATP-dependent DNA helicase PcrA